MIELLRDGRLRSLLGCCLIFGYLMGLNNLATPLRTLELTDSPVILGLVTGTWPLSGAVFSMASGVFADWYGRRAMMVLGFVFFGSCFAVVSIAPNWGWMLAGEMLYGFGDLTFWIAALALLTELAPSGRQVAVQGLGAAATSVGRILGPIVSGQMIGPAGFPATFLAGTALSLTGLALVISIRGGPERAPRRGGLRSTLVAYHKAAWRLLAENRAVRWASLAHVGGLFGWPALGGAFFVLFLTRSGFAAPEVGLVRSGLDAAAVLAQLGLAQTRGLASTPLLALGMTAVSGLTIGILPLLGGSTLLIVLVTCLGGVSHTRLSMLHGFAAERTDGSTRSMYFALHNTLWAIFNPPILLLAGFVVDTVSVAGAFVLFGAFVLAWTVMLWVRSPHVQHEL